MKVPGDYCLRHVLMSVLIGLCDVLVAVQSIYRSVSQSSSPGYCVSVCLSVCLSLSVPDSDSHCLLTDSDWLCLSIIEFAVVADLLMHYRLTLMTNCLIVYDQMNVTCCTHLATWASYSPRPWKHNVQLPAKSTCICTILIYKDLYWSLNVYNLSL